VQDPKRTLWYAMLLACGAVGDDASATATATPAAM